jgi:hypothetical protein
MFTGPRERLRVVNGGGEMEEEQSAIVVDPDEEDSLGGDNNGGDTPTAAEPGEPRQNRAEEQESNAQSEGKGKDRDTQSAATLEPPANISPSASLRASSIRTPTLHTAEVVRLERPRNRVRNLVESIESRSREGSPGGSPTRE